ncbi:MAG: GGDEF domain-containing protein [Solirubrobacterales bacterium]
MPDQSSQDRGSKSAAAGGSPAARLALKVSALHADLLTTLHKEIGTNNSDFAKAAAQLAGDFGSVTATSVEATQAVDGSRGDTRRSFPNLATEGVPPAPPNGEAIDEPLEELPSLYQPGHMRRRLEQLLETNRRYGHPFGLAVFDASGPDTRPSDVGQETVLSIVGAALRDSIRIVDEAFRLEEDAICVLAPNQHTVEGVQMAERLLGQLEDLERAGGLRICVSAGVVACPDHGADAEELLHKADAAMWRARALGQPVGVGALQDR